VNGILVKIQQHDLIRLIWLHIAQCQIGRKISQSKMFIFDSNKVFMDHLEPFVDHSLGTIVLDNWQAIDILFE